METGNSLGKICPIAAAATSLPCAVPQKAANGTGFAYFCPIDVRLVDKTDPKRS